MARIFNIYFEHEGNPYTALVSVGGSSDSESVKVTTTASNIQILLPNGNLVFPISEVLHRVTVSHLRGHDESVMRITDTISLQLLNTRW